MLFSIVEAAISPRVRSAMQIAAEQANLRLLGAAQSRCVVY